MKKYFIVLPVLLCCAACGPDYSQKKMYEFVIENHLTENIRLVPKVPTDYFWITSEKEYTVVPDAKFIIGSKITSDKQRKAEDIYTNDDVMIAFDLYINDIKQEKNFGERKFWNYHSTSVVESGKYVLVIDNEIIK